MAMFGIAMIVVQYGMSIIKTWVKLLQTEILIILQIIEHHVYLHQIIRPVMNHRFCVFQHLFLLAYYDAS